MSFQARSGSYGGSYGPLPSTSNGQPWEPNYHSKKIDIQGSGFYDGIIPLRMVKR